MKTMWRVGWRSVVTLLATAAFAMATTTAPGPGTLNYLEGQASLNGRALSAQSVHSAQMGPNGVLRTANGNAEVLLTPGVFLRLGNNSAIRMLSPGLANTVVALDSGSALLEVDQLYKENNLQVIVNGAPTRIEKTGLYVFAANPPSAGVLEGKAEVLAGNGQITLKKDHEAMLTPGEVRSQKLDKEAIESQPLYRWSSLRSYYDREASVNEARTVYVGGGWYGSGWYWDPYWSCYAFLPGDGFLAGPFGFGFYSPFYFGGFYGGGFHYGGFHHWGGMHEGHVGGFHAGGYHGGGLHAGGGFHAGGFGGFHGGGFGGFHGGGGHRG